MRPRCSSHVSSCGTSDLVSTEIGVALSHVAITTPISPSASPCSHSPLGESSKCPGVATPACHMNRRVFLGLPPPLQHTRTKVSAVTPTSGFCPPSTPSCSPARYPGLSPSPLRHSGWPAASGGQRCGGHTFSYPS